MKNKDIKYIMERYNVDFPRAFSISEYINNIMINEKVNIDKACDIFDEKRDCFIEENKEKEKNIYQNISIIFAILVVVFSIIIGANMTMGGVIALVFLFAGLTSCLFMYGFGEIIKQLKIVNKKLSNINDKK